MKHSMKLDRGPFEKIRSGSKTIELRLFDEKRSLIEPGDIIEFTRKDKHNECFEARVTALHRFDSFEQLYKSLPLEKCGYSKKALPSASFHDMEEYYSPEKQAQYGVVGIELEVLNNGESTLTSISKALSFNLRHTDKYIDVHGWADTDELISGMSEKYPIDRALLEKIVAGDDKGRYMFSKDRTRIRANHGHSVPVQLEYDRCEPPAVLYHGTALKNAASIETTGIHSQGRQFVHLSADIRTAKAVGLRHQEEVVVFKVDAARMHNDGFVFLESADGVWLTRIVPRDYIERLTD